MLNEAKQRNFFPGLPLRMIRRESGLYKGSYRLPSSHPMFEKVSAAPTLSDQVAQALLARIESGQLEPGEKLPPEAALAPEFGVSRTVVREAISRLKQGGLVESRQGSGVFVSLQPAVSPLKIDDSVIESREAVLQIVELRRAIESEAAALAAQRRSSSQLAEIESAFHAIDVEVAAGSDGRGCWLSPRDCTSDRESVFPENT
jgi:GntR family transcriptional regulator, transcriptional repressor for pyruvate dehydrogenase complex